MITAEIDCARVRNRRRLHEKLKRTLRLPSWYGMNLDALYDCLTEPREETVLRLRNPKALEKLSGGYGAMLLRTLEDAAEENSLFSYELLPEEEK